MEGTCFRRPKSIHQYSAKGSPTNTLKPLWCTCIFLLFPLKQAFWYTPNLFLPVEELEFSELKTPLVYTFSPLIVSLRHAFAMVTELRFPIFASACLQDFDSRNRNRLQCRDAWKWADDQNYRAKFYARPPPHPCKDPSRGGEYKRGGGMKFLPRGASKYTPPPSPVSCLMARNGGGGGG